MISRARENPVDTTDFNASDLSKAFGNLHSDAYQSLSSI